ncbi:MAG: transcription antitermination factor NusB [Clostridia bacterium]|nr:transcription antitermination factor NusB [Clostridia bacterium]MDY3784544.1 transcription antitermination factor NusB [Eubacteriales bacterium]
MREISRKEARIEAYEILFETEFRQDEDINDIYSKACEIRELQDNEYTKELYFGVLNNKADIDSLIEDHTKGWKVSRISLPALCAMRICVFEMKYLKLPYTISINEAIEITKAYDDDKTRAFVNGVLNGIKNSLSEEAQ